MAESSLPIRKSQEARVSTSAIACSAAVAPSTSPSCVSVCQHTSACVSSHAAQRSRRPPLQ